jgi:ferric-dicitrate binding protein FerR (iron transport regulator)
MADLDPDDGEGDTASLVRLAGPRPAPSAERTAEARARVRAAWRKGLGRRRTRRVALLLAAAGVAAIALTQGDRRDGRREPPLARGPVESAVAVAHLDAATGSVERQGAAGWATLATGEPLCAGCPVRTHTGGAGFRSEDGRSVRLAAGSRMHWDAADRLTLESGAVYVDSGRSGGIGSSFEVHTPRGVVRETGTQFEVRLEGGALRVRVREGRVAVGAGESVLDVTLGAELRLDDGGAARRALPPYGPEWSWVLRLAPGFDMEGRTLHDLLAWASRESGWELRYADAESRRRSEDARLHGSLRGVRPDEAVAVIPTTGLSHRLVEGVLVVGPIPAGSEVP